MAPVDACFDNLSLMREVGLMRSLKHRHIVQYLGTSVRDNALHLLLEYVPGTQHDWSVWTLRFVCLSSGMLCITTPSLLEHP